MANTRKVTGANSAPSPADVLALITGAQLPRRTVPLCLRGDLVSEVDELEEQLSREKPADRLTGNAEGRRIATRIEELRAEMQSSTVNFRLQALPRRGFQKFAAEHAPREGNAEDKALGINTETYFVDLVRACLVEPELDDEQFETFIDRLAIASWRKLTEAATDLNLEAPTIPFSQAASLYLRRSPEK